MTARGLVHFAVTFIRSPVASLLSCSQSSQCGFPSYLISLPRVRTGRELRHFEVAERTSVSAPVGTLKAELGRMFPLLLGGDDFLEAGAGKPVSTKSLQTPGGRGARKRVSTGSSHRGSVVNESD